MSRLCLLVAASVLIVSACSTPYQESGFMGGVSASILDGNTAKIYSNSNAYTSSDVTWEHALLKAAETTSEKGFDYFVVMNSNSRISYSSAIQSDYSGNATHYTYAKPETNFIIDMYPGPVPRNAPAGVFSAAEIIANLGPKYIKS